MRIEQWDVLRVLLAGPLTEGELAGGLSRKPSSIARSLTTLQGRGLVDFTGEREHTAPNHPKGRWRLTQKGASVAKKAPIARAPRGTRQGPRPRLGLLERHQGFVTASVTSAEVPALLDVLSSRKHAFEASFVARLDGDGHDYLFVFDPQLGAGAAERLAATLARFSINTGVIADVRSVDQLMADARAARGA